MLLFNQTKNHLRWKISMETYTCEPYGSVEIPDMFVKHCKSRKLPLDVSPVAPEVRAQTSLDAASEAARNDELILLRNEVELAKASEKEAKRVLELEKLARAKDAEREMKTDVSLAEAKRVNEELLKERTAHEQLLSETAKDLETTRQTVKRLEATVEELRASRKEQKSASK